MSYSLLFEMDKSSDEKITKTVIFDDNSTAPIISSYTVKVYDSAGADVTSTLLDSSGSAVVGNNRLNFRCQAGSPGARYVVKATATMASGDVMDATGELKINNPS